MSGGYSVATGGLPYFGRAMAALLSGDGWQAQYLETRGWRPDAALRALTHARRAAVLYQLGGQIGWGSRPHLLALTVRTPMVMHWTGTDVLYARRAARRGRAVTRLQRNITHWAGAPWLAEELRSAGVAATWQPHSAIAAPAAVPSFPERFTILAYLRPGREQFYGAGSILQAAAALPEARILVAGTERLAGAPSNVRCLGWVQDMAAVYADSHVLLRLAAHDGLAFMVQEALAYGRHAVWNHSLPGVFDVRSTEQAIAQLHRLRDNQAAGRLAPNETGAQHVRERFNPARIRAELRSALARVIEARR